MKYECTGNQDKFDKAHFGLCWTDVDVYLAWMDLQAEVDEWRTSFWQ